VSVLILSEKTYLMWSSEMPVLGGAGGIAGLVVRVTSCLMKEAWIVLTISISMERGRNMSRDAIRNVLKSRVSVWYEYGSRRTCRNITSRLTTEELVASTSSSYILTLGPNPISFDVLVEHHMHATSTRLLFVHFGLPWRPA
jgi:hypothetical protein